MRKELLDFNWHGYGLDIHDFDYTLRLVQNIIQDRIDHLPKKVEGAIGYDADGNIIDSAEMENEVLDDIAYYTWIDNFYVCHFGLWRLQGIFEGILKQEFPISDAMFGLKKKLTSIIETGYTISSEDVLEIMEWAKLRNALTHYPPERYRPHGLTFDDVKEYCTLITRVSVSLLKQKKEKSTGAAPTS
jgi:hypothetical protein